MLLPGGLPHVADRPQHSLARFRLRDIDRWFVAKMDCVLHRFYSTVNELAWIAEQFVAACAASKLICQKALIAGVFKKPPNEISHSGKQLPDRTVFPDPQIERE